MNDSTSGLTMNKWLLLLLATLACGSSAYRHWLQQDWSAIAAIFVAWLLVIVLIQRHRRRGTAVLAAPIVSLQHQMHADGEVLQIADERWPLQAILQVEMGVIDQQRAYLYLTIDSEPAPQIRKFLIPFTEYEAIRQQLSRLLPEARWLLP